MPPLCRRAFLVGDLPFGSYEASVEQAVHSGIRLLKEGNMQAIKLEGEPVPASAPFIQQPPHLLSLAIAFQDLAAA